MRPGSSGAGRFCRGFGSALGLFLGPGPSGGGFVARSFALSVSRFWYSSSRFCIIPDYSQTAMLVPDCSCRDGEE